MYNQNKKIKIARLISILTIALMFVITKVSAKDVIASYYASDANYQAIANIPVKKLTHVLYAFLAICGDNQGAQASTLKAIATACKNKPDYTAVLLHKERALKEFEQFKALKAKYPHLILLPSFGGWTLSKPFHDMALKAEYRRRFVKSAIQLIETYSIFDGIDIDWEYPGGGGLSVPTLRGKIAENEKEVFTLLMKELRRELDGLAQKNNRNYQLTAAVSATKAHTQAIDWQNTAPVMDYVFVMTYDFRNKQGKASHHTNLFAKYADEISVESMINQLIFAGVNVEKLVVGAAFYGRGWRNTGWNGQDFTNANFSEETTAYVYKTLVSSSFKHYRYGYDNVRQAAYLYHKDHDEFITFDDPQSIRAKVCWLKLKGLAGVFSWQITQDNGDLIDAMVDSMNSNQCDTK